MMREINYDQKMEVIKPPKETGGRLIRYIVMAVLGAAAVAGFAYIMSQPKAPSALNGQQVSQQAAPQPMQLAANEATNANPAIPARPALDPVTQAAPERHVAPPPAHRVPPPQRTPAEPAVAPTPPVLPPAADPGQAIPEVTPQNPPG